MCDLCGLVSVYDNSAMKQWRKRHAPLSGVGCALRWAVDVSAEDGATHSREPGRSVGTRALQIGDCPIIQRTQLHVAFSIRDGGPESDGGVSKGLGELLLYVPLPRMASLKLDRTLEDCRQQKSYSAAPSVLCQADTARANPQ